MGRVATDRGLRVVAFDPTSMGFVYAALEGIEHLIDYENLEVPAGAVRSFSERIAEILKRYQPDVVVLESPVETRRRKKAKAQIKLIEAESLRHGIPFSAVTRNEVRKHLGWKGETKDRIALSVTRYFPKLLPLLPPERKCYMSEHPRMNLFDAASFALTFFKKIDEHEAE